MLLLLSRLPDGAVQLGPLHNHPPVPLLGAAASLIESPKILPFRHSPYCVFVCVCVTSWRRAGSRVSSLGPSFAPATAPSFSSHNRSSLIAWSSPPHFPSPKRPFGTPSSLARHVSHCLLSCLIQSHASVLVACDNCLLPGQFPSSIPLTRSSTSIATRLRPSTITTNLSAMSESPSSSHATQTGRPSLWTESAERKLARLYLYTTLPLVKIVEVVHKATPGNRDCPGYGCYPMLAPDCLIIMRRREMC